MTPLRRSAAFVGVALMVAGVGMGVAACGGNGDAAPSADGTVTARAAGRLFTSPLLVKNALGVPVTVRVTSLDKKFWWDPQGAVPTAGPPAGLNGATVVAGGEAGTEVAYDTRCAFTRNGRQPWLGCGDERAWFTVAIEPPGASGATPSFDLNLKDTGSPRTGPRWGPRKLPERSSAGCDATSLTIFDQRFTYRAADGSAATGVATIHCRPMGENLPYRGRRTTITVAPA